MRHFEKPPFTGFELLKLDLLIYGKIRHIQCVINEFNPIKLKKWETKLFKMPRFETGMRVTVASEPSVVRVY